MPAVETEIKLRIAGLHAAREALAHLGARLVRPRYFEDNLLLDDAMHSLKAAGKVLRLRRDGARGVLTFKGPRRVADLVKSREEIEVEFADPDAMQAILAGVGLTRSFRYQKYREVYVWGDAEIVIDETPIGTFLEIEAPAGAIHEAARGLGRSSEEYILESYAALFETQGGQGDMVFP